MDKPLNLKPKWRTTCIILLLGIVYINVVIFMLWQSREWTPQAKELVNRPATSLSVNPNLPPDTACGAIRQSRWCQTV